MNNPIPTPAVLQQSTQYSFTFYQSVFTLLDMHDESFFIVDKNHRLVFLNRAAQQRNTEFHAINMATGSVIYSQLEEPVKNSMRANILRAFKGESFSFEMAIDQLEPKEPLWLLITYQPLLVHNGQTKTICLRMKDITVAKGAQILEQQQKQMEKELLQSRELFASFMQGSPALSWITDRNGTMLYMNEPMLNTFKFQKADIGKSIFELFDKQLAAVYHQNNCNVIKGQKQLVSVDQAVQPDGAICTYKTIKFPVVINGEIMAGGWAMDITDQKLLEQQLVDSEVQKKKELMRTVLETQEKERREIAYELHENVAQVLATAKQLIGLHETNANLELSRSVQKAIKEAINDLRMVSNRLNPFSYEQSTIVEALNYYLQMLPKEGCRFTVRLSGSEKGLNQRKRCVLHILQECVRNVRMHSGATEATIELHFAGTIRIRVSDNGTGFDPAAPVTGLGFKSMQHRMEHVNGSMQVASSPEGTTVSFEIPFCTQ